MSARLTSYEPLPRSGHTAVAVDNKLHIWGGFGGSVEKSREEADKIEMFDISKELWGGFGGSQEESRELAPKLEVLDISTELWEQKPTDGTPPPGLWNTAYTVVGSCLFVFRGSEGVSRHNILFKLDLHTFQWEEVQVSNPYYGPQRKHGCGMVSYGDNQLVVFAGYAGNVWTDEVHVFDLDKGEWSSPAVTGTRPPHLTGFSFTKVDSRRAVVYGGWIGRVVNGDAYVLELDKWHWTKLDTTGGPRPPARDSHAACCISGPLTGQEHPLLLVGGGFGHDGGVLNDMWVLDVDRGVWSEVTLPQEIGPRYDHTATVFGSGLNFRMVVMFGGKRKWPGDPIAEKTLLHLEWREGRWQVTRVVTKEELGGPVERLREQMEKVLPAEQLKKEEELPKIKGMEKVLPAEQLKKEEELPKIKYSDLKLVKTVGSGGFGEVFKGQWKSKDKPVAIKKFKFGEMEREVTMLATLDHPHVIQFYGIVTEQPIIMGECIVTEFAENGSIYDYLHKKHKKPTLKQSILWAKEVTEGMIYCHQKDIIHRDLKSNNVVLTSTLTAKICDLGSARYLEYTQLQTTAVGTWAWMAPEMLRREPVSKACDVYSFGIFLWEILTRKEPFADIPAIFLPSRIVEGERPPIPETCDSHLAKLMTQCWQDDPKVRPRFVEILKILENQSY